MSPTVVAGGCVRGESVITTRPEQNRSAHEQAEQHQDNEDNFS